MVRPIRVAAFCMQLCEMGEAHGNWDPDVLLQLRHTVLVEAAVMRWYGPMVLGVVLAVLKQCLCRPASIKARPVLRLARKLAIKLYDFGARLPSSLDPDQAVQLRLLLGLVPLINPDGGRSKLLEEAHNDMLCMIEKQVSCDNARLGCGVLSLMAVVCQRIVYVTCNQSGMCSMLPAIEHAAWLLMQPIHMRRQSRSACKTFTLPSWLLCLVCCVPCRLRQVWLCPRSSSSCMH
jgi:hypothetical protein